MASFWSDRQGSPAINHRQLRAVRPRIAAILKSKNAAEARGRDPQTNIHKDGAAHAPPQRANQNRTGGARLNRPAQGPLRGECWGPPACSTRTDSPRKIPTVQVFQRGAVALRIEDGPEREAWWHTTQKMARTPAPLGHDRLFASPYGKRRSKLG